MKPRHIVMALALATSAWLSVYGETESDIDITEAVVKPTSVEGRAVAPRSANSSKDQVQIPILPLQSREILFAQVDQSGRRKEIFVSHSWAPPPPPPSAPPAVIQPSSAPSAPPLPFTYLGKKREDGKWEVYLSRGDQTIIAHEQSVIDKNYHVSSITPPTLLITYVPLNQAQSMPIGEAD